MGQITYIEGDLLASQEVAIIHGCNAQGVMGSGVAKAIRDRYPDAYSVYRRYFEDHIDENILGHVVWAVCDDRVVGNAITQRFYGRDSSVRYCDYEAIAKVFEEINVFASAQDIRSVGMPLIGAGLANGSWKIISAIVEATSTSYRPNVYLLDGVIPDW